MAGPQGAPAAAHKIPLVIESSQVMLLDSDCLSFGARDGILPEFAVCHASFNQTGVFAMNSPVSVRARLLNVGKRSGAFADAAFAWLLSWSERAVFVRGLETWLLARLRIAARVNSQ